MLAPDAIALQMGRNVRDMVAALNDVTRAVAYAGAALNTFFALNGKLQWLIHALALQTGR